MRLAEILQTKGSVVHTIGPEATLDQVVEELVRHNIGSLIVCQDSSAAQSVRVLGIITERDILRAQAVRRLPLEQMLVADLMSTDLITASPQDPIEAAMRLMTENRVRHLPIMDGDDLHGLISIGDIVKAHHDELELENHYMRSYIQGEGAVLVAPSIC